MNNKLLHSCLLILAVMILFATNGCKKDDSPAQETVTPITDDLFPLTAGHQYQFWGYLVKKNTVDSEYANTHFVYQSTWTLIPTGSSAVWLIKDSTTVGYPNTPSYLQIMKTSSGDFSFRQTLGPFYRAFNIAYTDTLIWVEVAKPSVGLGVQWTAFDTTINKDTLGTTIPIHLQIFGKIEAQESITDSTSGHVVHNCYRVRTWRKISVGTSVVQDDATTGKIWLAKDVGPVQLNIAGDSENYGHFRVMKSKNF